MDKLKAVQKAHETKIKKQSRPPAGMGDVCKGHGMEEKGETKRDKERKE